MFAPDGYTSLANLWLDFALHHKHEVYEHACTRYRTPGFIGHYAFGVTDEFGSPKDLLEQVFIETLRPFELALCKADGQTATMPSGLTDYSSDIFQRLLVFESTSAAEELSTSIEGNDWVARMGSSEFEAWPHKLGKANWWGDAYPVPDTADAYDLAWKCCRYHRLPMWFERHRFVIPTKLPPWTHDAIDGAFAESTAPQLLGRSMCLENNSARKWRSENVRGDTYREALGLARDKVIMQGRPKKMDQARHYFSQLFPDGKRPSWKKACAAIEKEFGFEVSEKTLQRALRVQTETNPKGDKNLDKNPDKTRK